MTVTLSLAAWVGWMTASLTLGALLARWVYRAPTRRAQVETSPTDLRATLDADRDPQIDRLLAACRETTADGRAALFREAFKRAGGEARTGKTTFEDARRKR